MNDIPIVGHFFQESVLLYDIEFMDGAMFGELTRRSAVSFSNTVGLLRYNNHVYYVSNMLFLKLIVAYHLIILLLKPKSGEAFDNLQWKN